ncbi:MAG: hypothetical protein SFT81_03775 [Candidatus Caenarcaniphilales bacterium]|nr:hypothetical protein [Candidatus Caenarcaniphilales bacterium]
MSFKIQTAAYLPDIDLNQLDPELAFKPVEVDQLTQYQDETAEAGHRDTFHKIGGISAHPDAGGGEEEANRKPRTPIATRSTSAGQSKGRPLDLVA